MSDIHGDCKNIFDRFLDLYRDREVLGNEMVNSNYKANAKNVRVLIVTIVDNIKLYGRQNIPLPGQRDNEK